MTFADEAVRVQASITRRTRPDYGLRWTTRDAMVKSRSLVCRGSLTGPLSKMWGGARMAVIVTALCTNTVQGL